MSAEILIDKKRFLETFSDKLILVKWTHGFPLKLLGAKSLIKLVLCSVYFSKQITLARYAQYTVSP